VMTSWWLNQELLFREYGFLRLAVPPVIILAGIIIADAYVDAKKGWPRKALFGPILGFALVSALELNHRWALPVPVLAWGGAFSLLIVSTLRLTFPPVSERPQIVKIPTFWQKLELLPPSFSLRTALLPCVVLLAIILYLLISRP
jgi:hypothetical protein